MKSGKDVLFEPACICLCENLTQLYISFLAILLMTYC